MGTLNLAERLRNLQEDKHSELTIGAFFEFMRTAYQVNDSCEGLATILSANSEIDWHELAKINLDLETHEDNKAINNSRDPNTQEQQNKNNDPIQALLAQTISHKEASLYTSESAISSQSSSVTSCNSNIYNTCDKNDSTKESSSVENSSKRLETGDSIKETNQPSDGQVQNEKGKVLQAKEHLEGSEHGLAKVMKENLRDILHEGLLDSVLPYMLPKSALSQPVIRKSAVADVKKSSSLNNVTESKVSIHKEKDKEKNKTNKKSE